GCRQVARGLRDEVRQGHETPAAASFGRGACRYAARYRALRTIGRALAGGTGSSYRPHTATDGCRAVPCPARPVRGAGPAAPDPGVPAAIASPVRARCEGNAGRGPTAPTRRAFP